MKDYEWFKTEVFKLSSIDLNAYKERQMKRRIDSLIAKNGYNSYETYAVALKDDKEKYEEFINYLTINVSEFFRNTSQWDVLEKEVFPYLFERFSKDVNIWSAACSTGDEPYSLAMVLSKFLPLNKINILATDIDRQILAKAQMGLYNDKSVIGVPKDFKSKYFQEVGKSFKVSDEIKKTINFKQHNMLKDAYPRNLDLIVCRNVLIYFTEEAKDEIYIKFNQALKKEGILFVGSTEQIIQPQKYGFEAIRSFFYKKVSDL
ncbi:MAG: chemotaxis protein CheR [Firmicutes bacterium HGW-Firmicutes-1]|jgi:chemotaxis protein methyltransferase CheR|nr:MAG: chemotaxis protein CheR [Firmicutes bacterium HGW-Firmicutes-1]